ncbi:MAG: cupin domain-containing protein [Alkalinema sp. RL_2_19]|nr:cupin domain-containing protein [Alkalinema sp. RL_2_19]
MALVKQVEVRSLDSFKGGMAEFFTPQTSHETMLVQVAAGAQDDLFVHHYQTDQLLVVRGSMVLVVLQNRQYRYIPLTEDQPTVVQIPPGVPHGAINPSDRGCVLVNAVLRHGAAHAKDYRPLRQPFPYDMAQAQRTLAACQANTGCHQAAA